MQSNGKRFVLILIFNRYPKVALGAIFPYHPTPVNSANQGHSQRANRTRVHCPHHRRRHLHPPACDQAAWRPFRVSSGGSSTILSSGTRGLISPHELSEGALPAHPNQKDIKQLVQPVSWSADLIVSVGQASCFQNQGQRDMLREQSVDLRVWAEERKCARRSRVHL